MTKLSKEICKKYRNECHGNKKMSHPWDDIDEIDWKYGTVNCAASNNGNEWLSTDAYEVPDYCPYKLEHIVMDEEQNDQVK